MKPKHRRRMLKVLKRFSFEEVHNAMVPLKWFWALEEFRMPTIEELKNEAKNLLVKAYPDERLATGGFTVEWHKGHCFLAFYIDEIDSAL